MAYSFKFNIAADGQRIIYAKAIIAAGYQFGITSYDVGFARKANSLIIICSSSIGFPLHINSKSVDLAKNAAT